MDALNGNGKCPGCKEEYQMPDDNSPRDAQFRALPPPGGDPKMERRLSLLKSNKPGLLMNHTSEFDHSRWLYETKGTYGYGNAVWPKDDGYAGGKNTGLGAPPNFLDKARRPLSRKSNISAGIISPYRYP
jgi:hypothetical protein